MGHGSASVIEPQLGGLVELADDEGAGFHVDDMQNAGKSHFAAEAEQVEERGFGEKEAGRPGAGDPDDGERDQGGDNALPHEGPDSPAQQGQGQAHGHACNGGNTADDGRGFEIAPALVKRPVHAGGAVEEHVERSCAGEPQQLGLVVEAGEPGCRQKQHKADQKAHAHIEPEHGAAVFFAAVELAHQRCAETCIGQLGRDGKEDGGEPHYAHFRRGDEAGEHHAVYELERLHGDALQKAPLGTADGFLFDVRHESAFFQVQLQEIESALLLAAASGVDSFPVNGCAHAFGCLFGGRVGEQAFLQAEGAQQGIKAGGASRCIPQADKGFVEDDGKHAAVERIGDNTSGLLEATQPLGNGERQAVAEPAGAAVGGQVLHMLRQVAS